MPSDEIRIASTTDSQEAVNAAAGIVATEPSEGEQPQTDAEPETAETQQESEKPEVHKPKSRFEQRISELTKVKYKLQDELDDLREENARLKAKGTAGTAAQPETTKTSDAPTRPKPLSTDPKYKTYEDFTEDLATWSTEQVLAKQQQVETQRRQNERLQENFNSFNAQIKEARVAHDDWDEVAESVKGESIPKVSELAAVEMENGAEVLYYIAKHPEVREKLIELNERSEFQVIQEMGRISDLLAKESPVAEKVPVSSAPAPLKPVGGNATRGTTKPPGEMSHAEYKEWRKKHH